MKSLLSLLLMLGTFAIANAQSSFSQEEKSAGATTAKAEKATPSKVVYVDRSANPMAGVEMKVADGWASFHNLDGMSGLRVYITNGNGNVEIDRKLSSERNAVDINRLKKGLYFVTLINENTSDRRSFTLNK